MPCVPVVEPRVAAPIRCVVRKERAILDGCAIVDIIRTTKFYTIAHRVRLTRTNSQPWKAIHQSHRIDIPQRDEPMETVLLMRCCSISSFAPSVRRIAAIGHRCMLHSNPAFVIRNRCFPSGPKH